jgi:hypothetical protein
VIYPIGERTRGAYSGAQWLLRLRSPEKDSGSGDQSAVETLHEFSYIFPPNMGVVVLCRGEAQQTQLAMSLVLHRIRGIGSPRDFIRFSRCQFGRILNRSGFEGMFPQGRGGAAADVRSLSWAVRPFHRFTKSHERY